MACEEVSEGLAVFTVTFPATGGGQAINRLCIPANGEFVNINFSTMAQPQGIPAGPSGSATATAFADALNTSTIPEIVNARNYYGLVATRYNNIVTVKIAVPPHQCGEPVSLRGYSLSVASVNCGSPIMVPYVNNYYGTASSLQCCDVNITCSQIGLGRQGVKIVFPAGQEGLIWRLRIGELIGDPEQLVSGELGGPACLEWDFLDLANSDVIPDVPDGADGYETAQLVYDTIRYYSIQNILSSVGGQIEINLNTITITWDAALLDCCADTLAVAIDTGIDSTRYAYAYGKVCCVDSEDITDPNCADYAANSYIERVKFINNGQTFGPGPYQNKRRYKAVLQYTPSFIPPFLWLSDTRSFDAIYYSNFEQWVQGFVSYYNSYGAGWFHAVNYLGDGVVEFVVNSANAEVQTSNWLDESAPGIKLQVEGTVGGFDDDGPVSNYDLMPFERISRTWCNQVDPPVITDPPIIVDPPVVVIFPEIDIDPEYFPPSEHDIINFDCCGYTVGGIKRIIIQDFVYFQRAFWNTDGVIISLLSLSPVWIELCVKSNSSIFDINEERGTEGIRFNIKLSSKTVIASATNRIAITYLIRRKIVAVIEDYNGRYWLFGDDGGLSIDNINHNSGRVGSDSHAYAFEFVGFSRYLPRTVLSSVGASLQIGPDCGDFVDVESGPVYVNVFGNCEINELGDNYFDV